MFVGGGVSLPGWKPATSWQLQVTQPFLLQVCEVYFILEPDICKDSSTEITCLLRALDIAADILARKGVRMPEHLVIEAGCPTPKLIFGTNHLSKALWLIFKKEHEIIFSNEWNPAAPHVLILCLEPWDGQLCKGGKEPECGKAECICHHFQPVPLH